MIPHQILLETSISQLRTLAAFLAEQMGEYPAKDGAPTPESRACKEILLTLGILIPKLQATRYLLADSPPGQRCTHCDEG